MSSKGAISKLGKKAEKEGGEKLLLSFSAGKTKAVAMFKLFNISTQRLTKQSRNISGTIFLVTLHRMVFPS